MDYRAIADLVWFSLLGLSALVLVTGLSIRLSRLGAAEGFRGSLELPGGDE